MHTGSLILLIGLPFWAIPLLAEANMTFDITAFPHAASHTAYQELVPLAGTDTGPNRTALAPQIPLATGHGAAIYHISTSQAQVQRAKQLIAELVTPDYKRRKEIKSSLVLMGDGALPAMFEAFRSKTPRHLDFLTEVLCERGLAAASAVPELIQLFQDPAVSPSIKHHFLRSLACIGNTSLTAQAFLISLVQSGDDAMRPWAVMSLERFDSEEAVVALAGALSDSRRSVREAAAEALSKMGPKAAPAIPALKKAVALKGTYLSMLAGNALRAIGTSAAQGEFHVPEQGSSEDTGESAPVSLPSSP